METTTCRPVCATRGPSSFGVRVNDLPMRGPHAAVGGVGTKRSCPWTQTRQGSVGQLGFSRRCVVGAVSGQGRAVAAFCGAAFSLRRKVLAARKEANCC